MADKLISKKAQELTNLIQDDRLENKFRQAGTEKQAQHNIETRVIGGKPKYDSKIEGTKSAFKNGVSLSGNLDAEGRKI